jgi:hypothetical protein
LIELFELILDSLLTFDYFCAAKLFLLKNAFVVAPFAGDSICFERVFLEKL